MESRLVTLGALGVSLLLSILLGELALQKFTIYPIHGTYNNRIPDPRLYYRSSPIVDGIDENGFRNEEALAAADIVAIGDSHTYGFLVPAAASWPEVLGRMLQKRVYNLGTGGYNVIQYAAILDEAFAKSPDVIAIGFYLYNDLEGLCKVLNLPHWRRHRKQIGVDASFCPDEVTPVFGTGVEDRRNLFEWLIDESAWLSAFRYVTGIHSPVEKNYRSADPSSEAPRYSSFATRFEGKPGYLLIDLGERKLWHPRPRATSGPDLGGVGRISEQELELGLRVFRYMKRRVDEHDVELWVLLIPSRHLTVHTALVAQGFEVPAEVEEAAKREQEAQGVFKQVFDQEGIRYVDSTATVARALNEAVKSDLVFYPNRLGSHPLAAGQAAYARALAGALEAHWRQ